jgi:DNA polymerase-3 subunit gamma/tau
VPADAPQPLSLYRRHRPRTFADVVGQDAVVRTLQGAVAAGRVHHAYLFVGSRGTGKTSMAKILAACLNCERAAPAGAEGAGGTTEPCGTCEACRAIAAARSLDVIEMDAASSNSVDDVRELRERVALAPVSGRHKVYILDEAHMLSTAAWNAFLKTLEEPPPHTVFVLATTEAQRVPATVVDRCHRFDFARPTVAQLAAVVSRVAAAESIEIPPEAVAVLARAATGSFRDALGTLEQLVAYAGPRVTLPDVLAVLGVTDAALLEETLDAVAEGDARAALLAVARCAEAGRDASAFAADLEARARELLVVATLGEVPAELALTEEADARLAAQAARVGPDVAARLLEQLGGALEAVRAGGEPRTQLELALVRAARPAEGSLSAVLARVERLEARVGGEGGGGAFSARPAGPSPAVPAPATRTAGGGEPPATREAAAAPAAEGAPAVSQTPAPPAAQAPAAQPPTAQEPEAQPPAAEKPPPPAALAPPTALGLEDVDAVWRAVVETVGAEHKLLHAVLRDAWPVEVRGEELVVAFASSASFLKRKAEDAAHRTAVTEALRRLTGHPRLRVLYELREAAPPPASAQAPPSEEEWVARFKEELDAEELGVETEELVASEG